MELTKDHFRQCAQILLKNGLQPPYYASMMKRGVPFWVWIDENGEFVPPPHTVDQPTVALP